MTYAVMYFHNVRFLLYKYTLYLAEYINQPAIDPASTGHDAVTRELWQRQDSNVIINISNPRERDQWMMMFQSCSLCATFYLVPILLHAEVRAAMLHEHVRLHKGLGVQ